MTLATNRTRRTALVAVVLSAAAVAVGITGADVARAERDIGRLCPAELAGRTDFADVAPGSVHARSIYCILDAGITVGRTATSYGPDLPVSRGQMASFLLRMLEGTTDPVPPADSEGPPDIVGNTHAPAIRALLGAEVIPVPDGHFRPDDPIRRDEMAGWMQGTWWWLTGELVIADGQPFHDLGGNPYAEDVAGLYVHGVVNGKHAGYDPAGPVTRAQMGSFVARLMVMHADAGHVPDIAAVTTTTVAPTTTTSSPPPDEPPPSGLRHDTAGEAELFALHNEARAAAGVPPLQRNACLDEMASEWAMRMASGTYGHRTEADIDARTLGCLPDGWPVGEIIGGHATIAGNMAQWMGSDRGHREIILGADAAHVGIGVWADPEGTLWAVVNFSS